jgi:hypothetical protein
MKYLNAKQVLAVLEAARENSTRDWAMLLLTLGFSACLVWHRALGNPTVTRPSKARYC